MIDVLETFKVLRNNLNFILLVHKGVHCLMGVVWDTDDVFIKLGL